MDPFVRRLVQRLTRADDALSRNRHFHTFESPEGKAALKTSRRLKALRKDILACRDEGGRAQLSRRVDAEGHCKIELRLERIRGQRTSILDGPELELLFELPGMREAMEEPS